MTIRLPAEDLEFAKSYAKEHGVSLTGLIQHYINRLEHNEGGEVPPEVSKIAGSVPADVDAREEYHTDMLRKDE